MEGEEGVGNAWEHSITQLWADLGRYRDLHLANAARRGVEPGNMVFDDDTGAGR